VQWLLHRRIAALSHTAGLRRMALCPDLLTERSLYRAPKSLRSEIKVDLAFDRLRKQTFNGLHSEASPRRRDHGRPVALHSLKGKPLLTTGLPGNVPLDVAFPAGD
jgi:hypothetical protein